jgi:hypothetical protein
MYKAEEKARIKRQRADQAIELAMQSRWEDAAHANRAIIELFPSDVDAYNRLGKALTELGKYAEGREAYSKALELEPGNIIARRNLERLASAAESGPARAEASQRVDPALFIEETGKTGVARLQRLASNVVAKMSAGDRVELRPRGGTLAVETARGEYLGEVEPKLGLRLVRLMQGGNRYAAAIASVNNSDCRVIIKEVYQEPSQAGRPSFPAGIMGEGFRPYIKESLLRHERQQKEVEVAEGGEEWEGETEAQEGDVRLYEAAEAEEESEEKDDEYEE